MNRIVWFAIFCALLGAAGYFYFHEWYGWLSATGGLALRYGPLFLWRMALRFVRRQLMNYFFQYLPSFVKRPVRRAWRRIKQPFLGAAAALQGVWKNSWLVRIAVIVPVIAALAALAYDAEGIMEFAWLFFIPFLTAAIFPEGFWTLVFYSCVGWLSAHGFERTIAWISGLVPEDIRERVRDKQYQIQRVIGERSRPMRAGATRVLQLLRKNRNGA